MSFSFKRALSLSLCGAVLLGLGAVAGCAEDQPILVVLRAGGINDSCEWEIQQDRRLDRLVVDVSAVAPIMVNFILTNNQPSVSPDNSNTLTDTSEVKVTDVDVKLTLPQVEGFEPIEYNLPVATDSLSGGDEFGYLVDVPSNIVQEQLAGLVPATGELFMNMTVQFHGLRSSNKTGSRLGVIDARPFTLPVRLCNGCLRAPCVGSPATDDPTVDVCFDLNNCQAGVGLTACGLAQNDVIVAPCCDGGEYAVASCTFR